MLMLNTDDGMLLLSEMGYRQKVDLMKVLIETLNLPDDLMEKYRHLFADIEKTHQLRNTMVHAMAWVKGSRRNSIRPVRVRARGKIIVLGLGFRQPDKDIDYTPDDLLKKAEESRLFPLHLKILPNFIGIFLMGSSDTRPLISTR
ncbi:MAG: hypothetical protein ACE10C_06810 [Candidatus Binatia bacterium]